MEMHTKKRAKKKKKKQDETLRHTVRQTVFHAVLKDTEGLGFEHDNTFSFSKNENRKTNHIPFVTISGTTKNKQWINYTHLQLVPSVIHIHRSRKEIKSTE